MGQAWEHRLALRLPRPLFFSAFLIAVVNASTLLLTRTQLRQTELGLRRVLGATPARLSRLLALEALVIATAAGLLGYAISFGGAAALRALAPPELPLMGAGRPDLTVFAFALAVSGLAALDHVSEFRQDICARDHDATPVETAISR